MRHVAIFELKLTIPGHFVWCNHDFAYDFEECYDKINQHLLSDFVYSFFCCYFH